MEEIDDKKENFIVSNKEIEIDYDSMLEQQNDIIVNDNIYKTEKTQDIKLPIINLLFKTSSFDTFELGGILLKIHNILSKNIFVIDCEVLLSNALKFNLELYKNKNPKLKQLIISYCDLIEKIELKYYLSSMSLEIKPNNELVLCKFIFSAEDNKQRFLLENKS